LEQDNRADLVNYRVKGSYYIVDRLFDRAQLRFGETPQTIVEIDKTASAGSQSQSSGE
jgi:type IV secretion system protein VirB9